jgi:hypothetical protein
MITTIKDWKEHINKLNEMRDIEKNIFNISTIKKEIEVEINIQHSIHSIERTRRHDSTNDIISNEDIKSCVLEATEMLIDAIIENKLNIGDAVLITRKSDTVNVVGSLNLKSKNDNTIIFKVITVMKTNNFINKKGTYQIII